ncbi:cell division protein ZipA C-terminal FtsZ-binding domain-containing protein, partial [Paraburkholderia sp. SG-MS1]|uniref:cell division protein ZipA C-terminal FtsZ-binding domain-containing protein n=1 Tax=Paraburkholderia sp. SG-MS1 TaxID=2023741 RepID=UPI001EECA06F
GVAHAEGEHVHQAEAGEGKPAPVAHDAAREDNERAEPILPAATTISSAPPAIVDRRIDCIVPIRLNGPVAGDKVIPLAQRLRRAGSKPVHIEGKPEGGAWELLQNGARYEELRAAAQLANRSGALNELEFSEFVTGVQQFADALDASPEFPDMLETVAMARELDGFAAQCDAQLSINVLSDGAPWSANYVQAVASQDGLLLSRDGTRFVKLDARQSPVFMLQFGDTNFLRDDLTYKGGQMITLVLDVPVADEDILPFRLMCDYAKSLAERIGGRVVDDGRRPLPETALLAIEKQLMTLYAKLEQAGIPAGSPATRRLFSQ